jgi:hypothetical protein
MKSSAVRKILFWPACCSASQRFVYVPEHPSFLNSDLKLTLFFQYRY